MKKKSAILGLLAATLAIGSCLYQNNPLAPNQPPVLIAVTPEVTYFSMVVPDSCTFIVRASDPDGDDVQYKFLINDSLITTRNEFTFRPVREGQYAVRAEARDLGRRAVHEWYVTVFSKGNKPPDITWWYPEQSDAACAVGDTLEFHFHAEDPGDTLIYSYYLDSRLLHSGSSDLMNRFMQTGEYLLEGVASDGQYADTVKWTVTVSGFPDTIAPGTIADLTGGPGEQDGSLWLEWTAPGDDGVEGRASSYMVRTSTYPILTEQDWRQASSKTGEPRPSPAGTRERMVIRNLGSATYVYIAMKASDDFFNVSPLGNCARVLTRGIDIVGRATDAITGEPLPGVYVANEQKEGVTDANGEYALLNVPSYTSQISARDEKTQGDRGSYYDIVQSITSRPQVLRIDFPLLPVCGLRSAVQPDFYENKFYSFFKDITETSGDAGGATVFKGWNHWPITVYDPPQIHKGVDLQAAARAAMSVWEGMTGLDLFTEVPTPGEADVIIHFDSNFVERHYVATTALNADGTPARREMWIFMLNTEAPIVTAPQKIPEHEFGHILGLKHSRNAGHLLLGYTTPQVDHVSIDEANVVKILRRYPYIYDFRAVRDE